MKYIMKPIRFVLGCLFIILKVIIMLVLAIVYFIWDLKLISAFERAYKECFYCFYESDPRFNQPVWRYETLMDFVRYEKVYIVKM